MTSTEIFAKHLKELRNKNGISLKELAKALDTTAQSLSLYEKAERTINIDLLVKVSKYFDVSSDYLLGLTENKTTDTDLKAVCDYTGLDENSINTLSKITDDYPAIWIELFINKYLEEILSGISGTFATFDNDCLWHFQLSFGQKGFEREIKPNCKELTKEEIKRVYTKWLSDWLNFCISSASGKIKEYIIELNNLEATEFKNNIDKISSDLYNYYVLEASENGNHNPTNK